MVKGVIVFCGLGPRVCLCAWPGEAEDDMLQG